MTQTVKKYRKSTIKGIDTQKYRKNGEKVNSPNPSVWCYELFFLMSNIVCWCSKISVFVCLCIYFWEISHPFWKYILSFKMVMAPMWLTVCLRQLGKIVLTSAGETERMVCGYIQLISTASCFSWIPDHMTAVSAFDSVLATPQHLYWVS